MVATTEKEDIPLDEERKPESACCICFLNPDDAITAVPVRFTTNDAHDRRERAAREAGTVSDLPNQWKERAGRFSVTMYHAIYWIRQASSQLVSQSCPRLLHPDRKTTR